MHFIAALGVPDFITLSFSLCVEVRQAVCNLGRLEKVPGDGDCLIWSLLRCLVVAGSLPEAVWTNKLRRAAAVRSCRQALINMPLDSPLRPRYRDAVTNCVDLNANDAQHDAAYLQFDIHASFVMEYLFSEVKGSFPVAGIRCLCYSRFDDILGEPESVTLFGGDANMLEIAVYNWTHDGSCGTHYDAVLPEQVNRVPSSNQRQPFHDSSSGGVPPPPQPHSEQRPLKRLRFKQTVEDRPAASKDSVAGTVDTSLQSLPSVPSEDFYRMKIM